MRLSNLLKLQIDFTNNKTLQRFAKEGSPKSQENAKENFPSQSSRTEKTKKKLLKNSLQTKDLFVPLKDFQDAKEVKSKSYIYA